MTYRPDPTRRSRNIGTAKQGHGQDNRYRLPDRYQKVAFDWLRGRSHGVVTRPVHGREMPFLVEETRADCVHACTVDDIARVLNLLPREHMNDLFPIVEGVHEISGIQGVVLGQPTRAEERHTPVWARLGYFDAVRNKLGPIVLIEAQKSPLTTRWPQRLSSVEKREHARLVECASSREETKRGTIFHLNLEAVRRVQLYHSLPHEVGHWVHHLEEVDLPSHREEGDFETLLDRHYDLATAEKEVFAHRYADEARSRLMASGALPFDRMLDLKSIQQDSLREQDFALQSDSHTT